MVSAKRFRTNSPRVHCPGFEPRNLAKGQIRNPSQSGEKNKLPLAIRNLAYRFMANAVLPSTTSRVSGADTSGTAGRGVSGGVTAMGFPFATAVVAARTTQIEMARAKSSPTEVSNARRMFALLILRLLYGNTIRRERQFFS